VEGIFVAQSLVLQVLGLAALGLEVWALVEAVRFRKDSYPAAGKQTKVLWVVILSVATAIGFLYFRNPIGSILSILSVAAAGVFMAGVRPALRSLQGRGRGPGGSSGGPYGGW
jgi:Protein of unknown function (DUF2516)